MGAISPRLSHAMKNKYAFDVMIKAAITVEADTPAAAKDIIRQEVMEQDMGAFGQIQIPEATIYSIGRRPYRVNGVEVGDDEPFDDARAHAADEKYALVLKESYFPYTPYETDPWKPLGDIVLSRVVRMKTTSGSTLAMVFNVRFEGPHSAIVEGFFSTYA